MKFITLMQKLLKSSIDPEVDKLLDKKFLYKIYLLMLHVCNVSHQSYTFVPKLLTWNITRVLFEYLRDFLQIRLVENIQKTDIAYLLRILKKIIIYIGFE